MLLPTSLQITSQLRPLYDVLVPLFVVGFFLAALVAIALSDNRAVRRTYIGGFFALLIVVNLFSPITPAPLMKWHKFSEVRETEQTEYVFRVVDTQGAELAYDEAATLSAGSVALATVQQRMRTEFSSEKNAAVARWLLDRADVHREKVTAQPFSRYLHFPRHGLSNEWTPERLDGYSEFTAVRLYRVDLTLTEDGTEVTSYTETLVYEYHEAHGTTVDTIDDRADEAAPASIRPLGVSARGVFA
jgi:hypothetical protein